MNRGNMEAFIRANKETEMKDGGAAFYALSKTVMQPCCIHHCRDWRETAGGLPASNHSPACENYKTEPFYKITIKGTEGPWLALETQAEVDEFIRDNPDEDGYEVKTIYMTRDQFEHLDEFDGF
jgi:hypothetical protein